MTNDVPRGRTIYFADIVSMLVLVIGLFLMSLVTMFLIRMQRGLLGIIIAGLTVTLMIYWLKEVRHIVRGDLDPAQYTNKWTHDILEGEEVITVIADVPGPAKDVKVELRKGSLKIFGGQGFKKRISVPYGLNIISTSYVNSILNVQLSRLEKSGKQSNKGDALSSEDLT